MILEDRYEIYYQTPNPLLLIYFNAIIMQSLKEEDINEYNKI